MAHNAMMADITAPVLSITIVLFSSFFIAHFNFLFFDF